MWLVRGWHGILRRMKCIWSEVGRERLCDCNGRLGSLDATCAKYEARREMRTRLIANNRHLRRTHTQTISLLLVHPIDLPVRELIGTGLGIYMALRCVVSSSRAFGEWQRQ
jgi:hypothetical protein